MRSPEYVLSEQPFIVRRTVRWSDCDPAGVAFTGKLAEYMLSAAALYSEYLADGAPSLGEAHGVDTPCRGLEIAFSGTLWPRDVLDILCEVGEVRQRSYDLHFTATRPDGTAVFEGRFSPICVRRDARVGTDIPASLRAVLLAQASFRHLRRPS